MSMWKEAQQAMDNVYDNTTFQDLVDREERMSAEVRQPALMYCI